MTWINPFSTKEHYSIRYSNSWRRDLQGVVTTVVTFWKLILRDFDVAGRIYQKEFHFSRSSVHLRKNIVWGENYFDIWRVKWEYFFKIGNLYATGNEFISCAYVSHGTTSHFNILNATEVSQITGINRWYPFVKADCQYACLVLDHSASGCFSSWKYGVVTVAYYASISIRNMDRYQNSINCGISKVEIALSDSTVRIL